METFYFSFKIDKFDEHGEEHRLKVTPHTTFNREQSTARAVKRLIGFVARILNSKDESLACKRIILHSAWIDTGKKRTRISAKEMLEAMLKQGLATKGREEQRITSSPKKSLMTPKRRTC